MTSIATLKTIVNIRTRACGEFEAEAERTEKYLAGMDKDCPLYSTYEAFSEQCREKVRAVRFRVKQAQENLDYALMAA